MLTYADVCESQAAGNDGNAEGGEIDITVTVGDVTVNVNKTLFVKFKDQKGLEMGLEHALLMLQVLEFTCFTSTSTKWGWNMRC
jgi:hypothetical protein